MNPVEGDTIIDDGFNEFGFLFACNSRKAMSSSTSLRSATVQILVNDSADSVDSRSTMAVTAE